MRGYVLKICIASFALMYLNLYLMDLGKMLTLLQTSYLTWAGNMNNNWNATFQRIQR